MRDARRFHEWGCRRGHISYGMNRTFARDLRLQQDLLALLAVAAADEAVEKAAAPWALRRVPAHVVENSHRLRTLLVSKVGPFRGTLLVDEMPM